MTTDQASQGAFRGNHPDIDKAARKIAVTSGLSAITLRRLVAVSGLTPGLIAQYEPSIAALVARTFSELALSEMKATEHDLAAQTSPLDGLRMLVDSLLHDSHDEFNSIWADAWSLGRRSAPVAKAARDAMVAWTDLVSRLIAQGIETGTFRSIDPVLVAKQFFALIDSTTAYAMVDYLTADDRTHLVRSTLEITLGLPEGALSAGSAVSAHH